MLKNHTILVTGGTGSLGKALARNLIQHNDVVIYSRNEERQYEMKQEFANPRLRFYIGDVRDTSTLKYALKDCDIAIHAAAMKDLIMVEEQPTQGYLNNIEGSRSFLQAVGETPSIRTAVGISTDKAASPTNAYGMTKYIMERLFIEANRHHELVFACSRFGNMIDSKGSLVNYWREHPELDIKLTHPEMTRFFFTLDDAVQTVIHTIENAKGGEIFVPKMKSAKILDILRLIFKKNDFEVIGLFPGEKIHEHLVGESESYFTFDEGDYYVICPGVKNLKPVPTFSTENATLFTPAELKKLVYR